MLKSARESQSDLTPGPGQETRIESEWQIEPEEEVLAELIVSDIDIHASLMDPKGQLISECLLSVIDFPKNQFDKFLP